MTPLVSSNTFYQKTFNGGMDTLSSDTQVAENAYVQLINGRTRFGGVRPVKKHIQLDNLPAGNIQGCCGVGDVLIVFINGFAYRRKEGNTEWIEMVDIRLNPYAEEIYTESVPVSFMNFKRTGNEDVHADIKLIENFKIYGSPACVVCQDGDTQPFLIIYDDATQTVSVRQSKGFYDWYNSDNSDNSTNSRQYVPIGKEMLYINGVLYIVSPDRKMLYRSITGRPLDFMINVDKDGNRKTSVDLGGAATTAFAFDFDQITCIKKINTPNSFLVGTRNNIYIVTLDYTNTVFGEPLFYISATIQAGIVNNKSFLELVGIGDYAFIDYEGVVAFNAVEQLRFNGRNSIFSLALSKLLNNVKQVDPACVTFDNYALFNLKTNYGYLIAVYDLLLQKWISFDITEITRVKQFAVVETDNNTYLYCTTHDNKVFKMYAGTEVYSAQLRTKSFVNDETTIEHKAQNLRCLFNGATYDGNVTLIEFVDEKESNIGSLSRITKTLAASVSGIRYPVAPPVIPNTLNRVDNTTFVLKDGLRGKKLAYMLIWNNDAELIEYELTTSYIKANVSGKETNKTLSNTYGS